MSVRRRACLAFVVVAGGAVFVPGAAAEAPDATGWWSVHRPTVPPLGVPVQPQAPATVPPGGLYVGGTVSPTGDVVTAVSALRFAVPPDATADELVLAFHQEHGVDRATGTVALQACPSAIVWTPEEGGPITSAPPADCATGLALGVVDGSTVRIPLGGLVFDGALNIVVMPQPGSSFEAVFAKPGADAIVVTPTPPGDEAPPPVDPPSETPPVLPSYDAVGGDLAIPLPPAPAAPLAAVAPPPSTSTPIASGFERPSLPAPFRVAAWKRAVAAAVLAALAALYVSVMRSPTRAPRLLGAFATAERRGDDAS